jgi:hypothetical protein
MVSQPSYSTDLTLRGPSSVVSSRHSRRHGRGRSHAGGSSYVPQNDFPVFNHTGDVEIVVKVGSHSNRYLLHRLILTQCSGFFDASTSQEWSRATDSGGGGAAGGGAELARIGENVEAASSRRDVRKRWRYELDSGAGEDDIPMLVQKEDTTASLFGSSDARPPPVRNKPHSGNPAFFQSMANLSLSSPQASVTGPPLSQDDQDLMNDYDNLFRIFYNYPPVLDPIDIATAYIQCKSLLTLADLYDALAVVGPRVEHHLLQFHSRLWKQIAKYPSSYLRLGYLSQSKAIFQEALIHVVGAWPMGARHIKNQLPDSVIQVIEDKAEELEDTVAKIEGQLFRLTLTTSRGDRVTPYNSYLDWLVISFFRQWLAENTSPSPSPPTSSRPSAARNSGASTGGTHRTRSNSSTTSTTHQPTTTTTTTSTTTTSVATSKPPNLGHVYRTLGSSSSSAYLTHDECKRFLKLNPEAYSRENLKKFERRLDDVKAAARDIVRPLMRSSLLGAEAAANSSCLTCTVVDDPRDFPWLHEL